MHPKRKASYSNGKDHGIHPWNRNFLRGAKSSMRKCSCKAICMTPIIDFEIAIHSSFGCFRALLQNQGISGEIGEIVQNRTTRSKLRLLQHVWIFQGLWAIIQFTSLHPSFMAKILMTENIYGTEVHLTCYFIEARIWWKIHRDEYHLVSWCLVGGVLSM